MAPIYNSSGSARRLTGKRRPYHSLRCSPWRGQLNEINQLLCENKRSAKSGIHVCAGPPAPKDVDNPLKLLGMKLPGMKVLDCQNGFQKDSLSGFIDALHLDHELHADLN